MAPGLSDADRQRLERERERVQRKLARDRDAIHAKLAAERRRLADQEARSREEAEVEAAHLEAYGPTTVTGPDGVTAQLGVISTGRARFRRPPPNRGSGAEALGCLLEFGPIGWAIAAVIGLLVGLGILAERYLNKSGFVVWIQADGLESSYARRRVADEDTAAALFAAAAQAIRDGGLAGLRARMQP